jgi:hypothetical protein
MSTSEPPAGGGSEPSAAAAPCPTCAAAGALCAQCDDAALEALLLSDTYHTNFKACPVCRVPIIKYRGHSGNHDVVCNHCKTYFCYCCLAYGEEKSGGSALNPHACSSYCSVLCDCTPCPDCREVTDEERARGMSGRCEMADSYAREETREEAAQRLAQHPAAVAAHKAAHPWWAGPCKYRKRQPGAAAQGAAGKEEVVP